jgi:membrane-associated phospholipid phosphatase
MFQTIDATITRAIFNFLNTNNTVAQIPYYLGLIPYELYVLPGMFIAIAHMLYHNTYTPLQFHLLPHWFAFSMATYIKHNIHRTRPGCKFPEMKTKISKNHCVMPTQQQSFPSGHTIIAFALATTLLTYLNDETVDEKNKVFLGIPFYNKHVKLTTEIVAIIVASMTAIHRIGFGYHYFGDVCIGALLGMFIGYSSYKMINVARHKCNIIYTTSTDADEVDKLDKYKTLGIRIASFIGILLCFVAIYDFFMNKLGKLTQLKH